VSEEPSVAHSSNQPAAPATPPATAWAGGHPLVVGVNDLPENAGLHRAESSVTGQKRAAVADLAMRAPQRRPSESLGEGAPPPRDSVAALLHGAVIRSGRRVVVLDDDPTGTQTVRDVPVVTDWSVPSLRWGLTQPCTAFFVSTNSRSVSATRAAAISGEVAENLAEAARQLDVGVSLISRGDSTLRGHFPAETDALAQAWALTTGRPVDAVLLCPAYLESGRVTCDDVHWVVDGGNAVPVAQTEFATDATFGYQHSHLPSWVAERSAARWSADQVACMSLHDIRKGGPDRVAEILEGVTGGRPVVVNALHPADLDVVVLGVLQAEAAGRTVLCRTGPSFVRARAGFGVAPPLTAEQLRAASRYDGVPHGLLVAGSHTQLTTRQLARALELGGFSEVELDIPALLEADNAPLTSPGGGAPEVVRAADAVAAGLRTGDVLLRTSRRVVTGRDRAHSLAIAGLAARALVQVVSAGTAVTPPRWVVAKGGITSSDVASQALGIARGWVLGQVLPGQVPVWEATGDDAKPGPLCVIFPGNVGDESSLATVVTTLRAAS